MVSRQPAGKSCSHPLLLECAWVSKRHPRANRCKSWLLTGKNRLLHPSLVTEAGVAVTLEAFKTWELYFLFWGRGVANEWLIITRIVVGGYSMINRNSSHCPRCGKPRGRKEANPIPPSSHNGFADNPGCEFRHLQGLVKGEKLPHHYRSHLCHYRQFCWAQGLFIRRELWTMQSDPETLGPGRGAVEDGLS